MSTRSAPGPGWLSRKLGRDAVADREDPHVMAAARWGEQGLRELEVEAEQGALVKDAMREELLGRRREHLSAVDEEADAVGAVDELEPGALQLGLAPRGPAAEAEQRARQELHLPLERAGTDRDRSAVRRTDLVADKPHRPTRAAF